MVKDADGNTIAEAPAAPERPTVAGPGSQVIGADGKVIASVPATPAPTFGTGVRAETLRLMANETPDFAAGRLSPEREAQYVTAIQDYRQPTQFTDPDSGIVGTIRREVPPNVVEAFRARGILVCVREMALRVGHVRLPREHHIAVYQERL